MAARTFSAQCPGIVCTCKGSETVTVREGRGKVRSGEGAGTFRKTLTYSPCAPLIAQGWQGDVATVAWA